MTARFDETSEAELREKFIGTSHRSINGIWNLRSEIRSSCLVYRELFPGDSILNHTDTTEWARPWNARLAGLAVATRINRLWSLYEWWAWLFDRRLIASNVLELVPCQKLAIDAVPPLTLRCQLHRHVTEYLDGLTGIAVHTREWRLVWLRRFEVFLNRLPAPPTFEGGKLVLSEEVLATWFHHICRHYQRLHVLGATNVLNAFFQALARKGVLVENVLERLRREYPTGKRIGVAYALAADDRGAALRALARRPTFQSSLAEHMVGFLSLKRATGCSCPSATTVLRDFDCFLRTREEQGSITAALLARWRASRPELSAGTRRHRWAVMHQFCLYLRRYCPETHVPDPLLGRLPVPRFKARIVQPSEMRQILDAVAVVVPGNIWALRPHICRTLFTLLYTTGLRIGEARKLQIGDVDLRQRVIQVRETKFYKSRLVPFSDGLLLILRDYHRRRIQLLGAPTPEAPFFVTRFGGHYKPTHFGSVWRPLMRHTGLDTLGARPRIHDLRHSFATLRLAAWYRDDEDVIAKLPLLSTYLGHASIAASQQYLTILPETLLAASERFRTYSGSLITAGGKDHALA
jgi:integrase/recombinase XerD